MRRHGGSITGEHGIGIEKSGFIREMFSDHDLQVMQVKQVFNPSDLCNPGKIFPTGEGLHEIDDEAPPVGGAVSGR